MKFFKTFLTFLVTVIVLSIIVFTAAVYGVYVEDNRIEAACVTTKDVHFELRGKQYYCMDDAQVANLVQQIINKLTQGSKSMERGA